MNLVQDNENDEGRDDVENPPYYEAEELLQSLQSPSEKMWNAALEELPDLLEFPTEFLYDSNTEEERNSDREFEDEMGFPFQGSRYNPECSFPKE